MPNNTRQYPWRLFVAPLLYCWIALSFAKDVFILESVWTPEALLEIPKIRALCGVLSAPMFVPSLFCFLPTLPCLHALTQCQTANAIVGNGSGDGVENVLTTNSDSDAVPFAHCNHRGFASSLSPRTSISDGPQDPHESPTIAKIQPYRRTLLTPGLNSTVENSLGLDSSSVAALNALRGEVSTVIHPLKTALDLFVVDRTRVPFAVDVLDSAERILTNQLPQENVNSYVTGLEGHYRVNQRFTVGTTTENRQTFMPGQIIRWIIQWDWNGTQGPYVNVELGDPPSSKFAFFLDPSQYLQLDVFAQGRRTKTMDKIMLDLNKVVNYQAAENCGKVGDGWPMFKYGEARAIEDMKEHFKRVAQGIPGWPNV